MRTLLALGVGLLRIVASIIVSPVLLALLILSCLVEIGKNAPKPDWDNVFHQGLNAILDVIWGYAL